MNDFFANNRPDGGEIHEQSNEIKKMTDDVIEAIGTDKFILTFFKKDDLPCSNPACTGYHAATMLNSVTALDMFSSGKSLVDHALKEIAQHG